MKEVMVVNFQTQKSYLTMSMMTLIEIKEIKWGMLILEMVINLEAEEVFNYQEGIIIIDLIPFTKINMIRHITYIYSLIIKHLLYAKYSPDLE